MERFLFDSDAYERLYNCSWYSVEDVPLEVRRSPLLGTCFMLLAVLYAMCYLPAAIAMSRHLERAAYKIMFALAWWDFATLVGCGVAVGYAAAQGMMFCSSPTFMYLNGSMAFFGWLGASMLALLLAVNRIMELLSPRLAEMLFSPGYRVWLWVAGCFCYAFVGVSFSPAFTFNSILFSYFTNPHAGYYREWYKDRTYHSHFHAAHNIFVVVTLTLLYLILFIGLMIKRSLAVVDPTTPLTPGGKTKKPGGPKIFKFGDWERKLFMQVAAISLVNAVATSLFVYFQFFTVPPWVIYVGTYGWLSIHGLPSVIYLVFNQTIRNDCKEIIKQMSGMKTGLSVGGSASSMARAHHNELILQRSLQEMADMKRIMVQMQTQMQQMLVTKQ